MFWLCVGELNMNLEGGLGKGAPLFFFCGWVGLSAGVLAVVITEVWILGRAFALKTRIPTDISRISTDTLRGRSAGYADREKDTPILDNYYRR